MNIIIISGHAGSGKDTAAATMKDILDGVGRRTLIIHYADLLKFTLKEFYGWNGEKDAYGRELLQRVGTDVVRKNYPDYWVDYITFMLGMLDLPYHYVMIPDARFPNEIELVKNMFPDTKHLRVIRPEIEKQTGADWRRHPSETELDGYPYDMVIHNDGKMEDLRNACRALLWHYYGEDV